MNYKMKIDDTFNIQVYRYLSSKGIKTMYFKKPRHKKVTLKSVEILSVVHDIRLFANEEYAKIYNVKEGTMLEELNVDVVYGHVRRSQRLTILELERMIQMAKHIFNLLVVYFSNFNIQLEAAKIWFAKDRNDKLFLISNVSTDNMEFRDKETGLLFKKDEDIYAKILA